MNPNGVAFLTAIEQVLAAPVCAFRGKSARLRVTCTIAPDVALGTPGPLRWWRVHNQAHRPGVEWHGTPSHFYEAVYEKETQAGTAVGWLCAGLSRAPGAAVV